MIDKIKIGIVGYGNVGRGAELAINDAPDMELVGIFTRRDPTTLESKIGKPNFIEYSKIYEYENKIDVMLMCGGSATDLIEQSQYVGKKFNIVDTYDTHAKIPEYFKTVESVTKPNGKLGIMSVGWDPGLFSIIRMLSGAILPNGNDYTFWGKGVSQGHSDAIRRIKGVKNAIQYTIPVQESIDKVRAGENPLLTTRQKHVRECYVVLEEGADRIEVENEIKNMPNYFLDYDTTVHFIEEDELNINHSKMMHGGFVMRTGKTGNDSHVIEYSLNLESNPEFTGSVLTSYARACYKLHKEGHTGMMTVFDVPIKYLTDKSYDELLKTLL